MDFNDVNANAVSLKMQGDVFYRAGKFYDAVKFYSLALNAASTTENQVTLYNNRSLAYIQLFNYELALKDIEQCEKLDSVYLKGLHRKMQCHTMMGDMHLANNLLKKRQESFPEETDPLWLKVLSEYEEVNALLARIKSLMAAEDFRTALYHTDQLFNKNFRGPVCRTSKAECLVELERYEEAEKEINEIFRNDPLNNNPDALYVRGKCFYYLRFSDLKIAHELLKRALRGNPDHKRAQKLCKTVGAVAQGVTQAEEAAAKSQFREAFHFYTPILQLVEPNKNLHFKLMLDRALVAAKASMLSSAIVDCTSLLAIDPTCLKVLKCRAECYERLGRWFECYNDAQRICSINNGIDNFIYLMKIRNMLSHRSPSTNSLNNMEAYQILGISPNASIQEIRMAYKRLSLRYHPDKNLGQPDAVMAENAKQFHKVSEAYKTLTSHHSQ